MVMRSRSVGLLLEQRSLPSSFSRSMRRPGGLFSPSTPLYTSALQTFTTTCQAPVMKRRRGISTTSALGSPAASGLNGASGHGAGAGHIRSKVEGTLVKAQQEGEPIQVGMFAELTHHFHAADVATFASVSGDDNPLHLDEEYAKKQGIFKGAIVHGMLVGSMFSTIFGVTFPGCVYLQQSFKFSRPVYVGTPVTARVEVTRIRGRDTSPPSLVVFCGTHVMDEEHVAAIAGEAVVLITLPSDTTAAGQQKGQAPPPPR